MTDVIEMLPAERARLVEYVSGPFNPQASVAALEPELEPEPDVEVESWWEQQKSKAGGA